MIEIAEWISAILVAFVIVVIWFFHRKERRSRRVFREETISFPSNQFEFKPGQRIKIEGVGDKAGEWIVIEARNGLEHSDIVAKRIKEIK